MASSTFFLGWRQQSGLVAGTLRTTTHSARSPNSRSGPSDAGPGLLKMRLSISRWTRNRRHRTFAGAIPAGPCPGTTRPCSGDDGRFPLYVVGGSARQGRSRRHPTPAGGFSRRGWPTVSSRRPRRREVSRLDAAVGKNFTIVFTEASDLDRDISGSGGGRRAVAAKDHARVHVMATNSPTKTAHARRAYSQVSPAETWCSP